MRICSKQLKYLYLERETKKLFKNYLANFRNNREGFEKCGIIYKGGILLHGKPGCGKTSCITAIGTYLQKDIYYMDLKNYSCNEELDQALTSIKKQVKNGAVVVFEDIDCMSTVVLKNRDISDNSFTLSALLDILDGGSAPENFIFVITTNYREKLDEALIRPGRMDIALEIKFCNRYQLSKIYKNIYEKPLAEKYINSFPEYKFKCNRMF